MDELEQATKGRMRQQIEESLKPLFEKARKEKLLFRSDYQGIVFTPDELEQEQAKGHFVWGAVNWELIDPEKIKEGLRKSIRSAEKEHQDFLDRLKAAGY
jgi:hypothetical protein